jgi:hypothetical protein
MQWDSQLSGVFVRACVLGTQIDDYPHLFLQAELKARLFISDNSARVTCHMALLQSDTCLHYSCLEIKLSTGAICKLVQRSVHCTGATLSATNQNPEPARV